MTTNPQPPTVAPIAGASRFRIHVWPATPEGFAGIDEERPRFNDGRRLFAALLAGGLVPPGSRVCLSRVDDLPGGGRREVAIYYGDATGGWSA